MKKLIIYILLFAFKAASATNYYVSNTGNDAANGLTQATSWLSISKVNAATFSSGDSNKLDLSELPGQKLLKVHTYELSLLVQTEHEKKGGLAEPTPQKPYADDEGFQPQFTLNVLCDPFPETNPVTALVKIRTQHAFIDSPA